jgi:uncharacterized protein YggE
MSMKRLALLATMVLAGALAEPARAQPMPSVPAIAESHTLLTINADGHSQSVPDLALFEAGVTTQGKTAAEALGANSAAMTRVIAALKRAGIADHDIRTSNLGINPIYAPPRRLPDGAGEPQAPEIVAYQANNTVSVRQRELAGYGKVIDTLVSAGANQINGPNLQLDKPDAALDAARSEAVAIARSRAELYARAAGLRVVRIVSISEGAGYGGPQPVMYRMAAADAAPTSPPPVAAGEVTLSARVTVQFELAP